MTLVTFATNKPFPRGFGVSRPRFDGDKPSISLSLCRSLKAVLVTMQLEAELVQVSFSHVGYITLKQQQRINLQPR
jgi:hypothetical protein